MKPRERESSAIRSRARDGNGSHDATGPRGFDHVRFISAGAGSGKTYRLTEELERALVDDGIAPARVIGTTFTVKAAAELRERVRERLIAAGRPGLAEQTAQALIGTVHSVCERLLARFAFERALSPELHVASLEDCAALFNQALDDALSTADVRRMNAIAARLDMHDGTGLLDWRDDVKRLVDRARDNDIEAPALAGMGPPSAAAFLAFFPAPEARDFDKALAQAVRGALNAVDLTRDTTKTTAQFHTDLRRAIWQLDRPPAPWSIWMSLSSTKAAKAHEPLAAKVRAAAETYDRHPRFHRDVRDYIESAYAIASRALERFQTLKTERGLIDFSDMEQLTLRALDDEAVRARLGTELGLLLVDEFQDTNPMQLAIFMKLAALAEKVVLVGDVKQAIYAFRGCDPDLVFDTLAALAARGSAADVLGSSWRARPALVAYTNAMFAAAFEREIPREQIVLTAERGEATDEPAVIAWNIDGNGEQRAAALARAVIGLVESGHRVVDPVRREPRPATWGDIAVLARTNDNVETIARALRAAHVPMKMTLAGLLAVPEVSLAKACLRRLNDDTDTLATAEIVSMAECAEPEVWLAERLAALARGERRNAWGEGTHAIVDELEKLRAETGTQSPVEIVARVLNYVGIRDVVTAWGPSAIKAMQRQRNLDALLNLAVEYEHHCDAQHQAATLTGFLFWLEHPHSPELDLQPTVTSGDAVHVLTYHKAKGLEWPIVVATDFHMAVRSRIFDVRVERDGAPFDPLEPLASRVIQYWPNVFGRRNTPVAAAIVAAGIGVAAQRQAESEDRRLAYVGLTRARDCLVLATKAGRVRADAWAATFASDPLLPTGPALELPDGSTIPTRVESLAASTATAEPATFAPRRLPVRTPRRDPAREIVSPSSATAATGATVVETIDLGARIALNGDDMNAIGTALHAVIAAELLNPGRADALARAEAVLEGHGVAAFVAGDAALGAAQRFRAWIEKRFRPRRMHVEHPITHRLGDGRIVRGWIDVLLETDAGLVVIDHKSSPRPKAEWEAEALEHSGQLAAYRAALEAAATTAASAPVPGATVASPAVAGPTAGAPTVAGATVAGCWIHFPVSGGLAAVRCPA